MNTANIGNRRNLTPMQRVELVIKLEPLLTAKAEANRTRKPNSVPKISAEQKIETREELAKLSGVSHDTATPLHRGGIIGSGGLQ